MLKVLRPSKNKQTGNPKSHGYPAYDFDDIPDPNYYSSLYGKIVQAKNSETKSWTKKKGEKLTTNDYGNYCKIKGEIDGKTVYQLGAHFKQGTVLPVGTEVKRGQVVAQAGKTGNVKAMGGGDGSHSHTEYRGADNKNFAVEFVDKVEESMDTQTKEQIIIDVYKAETGEYPTEDEKKWRLQENLNTVELIESVHGDDRFIEKWVKPLMPEEDTDLVEELKTHRDQESKLKEILKLPEGVDNAKVNGKVSFLFKEYLDKEKQVKAAKDEAKKLMVDALGLWERFKMLFM